LPGGTVRSGRIPVRAEPDGWRLVPDLRALARSGDLARDLRDLARDLNRDLGKDRTLDRDLARDLGLRDARDLYRYPDRYFDRDLDRARDLRLTRDSARDLARAFERTDGRGQLGARRVVRSAVSLLAAASWLLPAANRGRYAEEYRAELWDLAQAGAGRIRQLRYAFCQLRNALRYDLRAAGARYREERPEACGPGGSRVAPRCCRGPARRACAGRAGLPRRSPARGDLLDHQQPRPFRQGGADDAGQAG
jgi:hypothetical protein